MHAYDPHPEPSSRLTIFFIIVPNVLDALRVRLLAVYYDTAIEDVD
jgi:hypothetical protein